MGKTVTGLLQRMRAFLRAERGNVAMMFGLALLPMAIAAGVGLDYARSAVQRQQMADALDAAALAVGSATKVPPDKIQSLAQAYFDANYSGDKSTGINPVVVVDNYATNPGTVTLHANYSLPTTLLKVINKTSLLVTTSTTVVWGQSKLWVALVLDNSGSMSQGDSTGSKMDALQNASHQLLDILQSAATNAGDVKVSIVPFTRNINIGTTNVSANWIDWTDWEAPPPNVTLAGTVGPGSNCPFTTVNGWGQTVQQSPYGFNCTSGSANGASTVNNIPTTGLICPGQDSGTYNTAHRARYYNGCWDSVATQSVNTTQTVTQPMKDKQTCHQTGTGPTTCTDQSGWPQTNGSSTSATTTTTTSGYSGDSTTTTTQNNQNSSNSDGSKSCTGSNPNKNCTWTRTVTYNNITATTVVTGAGPYSHTWRVNAHSTWVGCIMDRDKTYDYDISNTAPSTTATGFPAENPASCPAATVKTLGYDWTGLGSQIDAMTANGSTNQAIGMAHGWQTLSNSDPYNPGALPPNTSRYIIILSDGQNTQDRWWGDGSSEGTTQDGYIDDRMKKTCDAAKADGVVIYSIFVHVGSTGSGNSAPLSYCASDSTKYFALTTTSAVVTTFNQIAQQITNVRVSK